MISPQRPCAAGEVFCFRPSGVLLPNNAGKKEENFMSTLQKSTTLYKTPLSAAYWRDAAAELKDTKMLVFAALMIALRVALKLISIPIAPNLDINTAFLANALGAMVYGPVVASLSAIISDVLGVMLQGDPYFPPFVLTEIAGSLIFALFLYRTKVTPTRVILSRFCICLFVNILLQTPIMMLYYQVVLGGQSYVLTIPRILKNLFMFPIESVVLTIFLAFMQPITYRMKLTYNAEKSLQFQKKQVALLTALFIFGSGCVVGYLSYHYQTTSLTTGYTTAEQAEKGQALYAIIADREPEAEAQPAVAIVDGAYKPFLGKNTTYQVSLYAVDPAVAASDEMEGLWALKKTPASKHEALTKLANVEIVENDSTGEVLDFSYEPVA